MRPILVIGDLDFTSYVGVMKPVKNDLDADGSGRDIQTGKMYREKITDKLTWEVEMIRIPEAVAWLLFKVLNKQYYNAITLHPGTNVQDKREYYTSTIVFGAQRYIKSEQTTVYDGVTFQMIER